MEATDFYRRLTNSGSIFLKMGKVVINDIDAVEALLDNLPDQWPKRQKIVFLVLTIQAKAKLTPRQSMQFWEELDIEFRPNIGALEAD